MRASLLALALGMILIAAAPPARALRGVDLEIRSLPPGADVYLDEQYVGTTPLSVPVPCDRVVDQRYRVQYRDCTPAEGIVSAKTAPGKVVGMFFSLGISAIFQCPRYFPTVMVPLTGGTCERAQPASAAPGGDLAVQLQLLRDLHDRGELSDDAYEQARERVLNGL